MRLQNPTKLVETLTKYDHVIWDWNGTLLNDVELAVQTVNTILTEHNLPLVNLEKYKQIFDFPVKKYYDTLGFDYKKESFQDISHKFVDRFMQGVPKLNLVTGVDAVLEYGLVKKIKQSILSASDQQNLDLSIKHFNLNKYFSYVYGIDNKFAESKVKRGRELIAESKSNLKNTVMVGDTIHDLEVGQALGIDVILVSHGHHSYERLIKNHSIVI